MTVRNDSCYLTSMSKYGIFVNCLGGNVGEAIRISSRKRGQLGSRDRRDLEKLITRFRTNAPVTRIRSKDPLVQALVACYRTHYHWVLLNPATKAQSDKVILKSLKSEISHIVPVLNQIESINKAEELLKKELLKRKYHSLFGRVMPHRSLSIWTNQKIQSHKIQLPEGKIEVKVVAIDGLIEHGWMSYATFGKFYSGGWVPSSREAIYYVKKAYRRKPEKFRVSILAHEGQHAFDLKKYPKLSQSDLEYRAKLVELSISRRPVHLLRKFCAQAGSDRSSPHGYASKALKDRFAIMSIKVSASTIRKRALELLAEHSTDLKKVNSKWTRGVL